MSGAEVRARHYMSVQRWDTALAELATAIGASPGDGALYALQALCLTHLKRLVEADACSRKSIAVEPTDPFCHYIRADVLRILGRPIEAEMAAAEAIRLNPYEADYYSMLSGILSRQARWHASLAVAEDGLRLDARNADCLRMRAQALSFLGREFEAKDTAWQAVAINPDSAASHAELGWVNLRSGKSNEAEAHFREALRLDPQSYRARAGLFDSLRARFPPYRSALKLFAFVQRIPVRNRRIGLLVIVGLFIVLANLAQTFPKAFGFAAPIGGIAICLFYSSLLGRGLLNIIVVLHPLGRLAMSRFERAQAMLVVAFLAVAVILGLLTAIPPHRLWIPAAFLTFGALVIALFARLEGASRARWILL